ncbi:hypothetical protein ADM99_05160 [Leptolinea tardivitalis]|uniref:Uncharacterized protein n=1 Tax=Leptolinea tardivitalis TaxID=229920 RepID=A0A0P6X027_9CHLR|nr:hypothetical protein ADM99_05160 [Leptolinea tardivitalis]
MLMIFTRLVFWENWYEKNWNQKISPRSICQNQICRFLLRSFHREGLVLLSDSLKQINNDAGIAVFVQKGAWFKLLILNLFKLTKQNAYVVWPARAAAHHQQERWNFTIRLLIKHSV